MKPLLLLLGLLALAFVGYNFIHVYVGLFFGFAFALTGMVIVVNYGTEGETRGQDAATIRKMFDNA